MNVHKKKKIVSSINCLIKKQKYAKYIFSPEYAQVLSFILFIIVYGLSLLWMCTFYVRP